MKDLLIDNKCVEVTDHDVISVLTSKTSDIIPEVCDAVVIGDLGDIIAKHSLWTANLPSVEPFYVVNCNDDPAALSVLAKLGTGFVCCNKDDMKKVLKLHVPSEKIIYGSPCRPSSQLQFAVQEEVNQLTFESEAELKKLSYKHRTAELLLRINPIADDGTGNERISFGCRLGDVYHLLRLASQLESNVVGISMQLSDDAAVSLSTLCDAIMMARAVFDLADEIGFRMSVLDIGGDCFGRLSSGFCFEEFADVMHSSLEQSFGDRSGVRFIVECGHYFVESAFTIAVDILDRRSEILPITDSFVSGDGCDVISNAYYVSDGVYGSFRRLLIEPDSIEPILLNPSKYAGELQFMSSVRGPTCDSLDCLVPGCLLPALSIGDWLAFKNMGAFLFTSSNFHSNTETNVERFYIIQERRWLQLCLAAESKSCVNMHGLKDDLAWEYDAYDEAFATLMA